MLKIGTHSGRFHCDEVLACVLLKFLPKYSDADIIRSRDSSILDNCDIVVDVGGIYDPAKHRYDHHQREFTETMSSLSKGLKPWTTKLSSAGLVYFHFGVDVIKQILIDKRDNKIEDKFLDVLYDKMYKSFVEEIDAGDNGINRCDCKTFRYRASSSLPDRVGWFNPAWNQKTLKPDDQFKLAMEFVKHEFLDRLFYLTDAWIPARKLVTDAFEMRKSVHPSGKIMKLEISCPWKEHLCEIEKDNNLLGETLFVVFNEPDSWRVQAVPLGEGETFDLRTPLKPEWGGKRNQELNKLVGSDDCVFVHNNLFIGGAKSYDTALSMAVQSLA